MSLAIRNNFLISPNSLTEAMDYAKMIANSSFCPSAMKGKAGDVIIAMQMGAEVGLSPMQALQNIAIINGRPSLWGDAALALVLSNPHYITHREWIEGTIKEGNLIAYCAITRKNSDEYVKSFSQQDAQRAGLWNKEGPWKQYPERMLQMRARAFCIRDKFADALKGINFAEEVSDYTINRKTNASVIEINTHKAIGHVNAEVIAEERIENNIVEIIIDKIQCCETIDKLKEIFILSTKNKALRADKDALDKIISAKDKKVYELEKKAREDDLNVDNAICEILDEVTE